MNTLFIGSTRQTDTSLHYYSAFLRLGHRVLTYDPGFFEASSPLQFAELKWKKGPTSKTLQRVQSDLIHITRTNHWDFIFVMGQNFISETLLLGMRDAAGSGTKFAFHSHDNLFSNGVLKGDEFFKALEHYDAVFTTKSQNVELYKSLGQPKSYFVPSAFEPSVHFKLPPHLSRLKRTVPVSFVGTFDSSRMPFVQAVGWERLEVWGDRWQRYPGYPAHRNHIHPQAIYYLEFADVISNSLISLGLLREEAHDKHTQRTFEIPACGALQMAPRNEELQLYFEDGKEIILFDSVEELRSKVDYFLKNDTERRRIAAAGHERCLAGKHTYQDRVKTILDTCLGDAVAKTA